MTAPPRARHTALKVPFTANLRPKIIGVETNREAFHSNFDLSYTVREVVDVKIELVNTIDRETYRHQIIYAPRKHFL